MQAVQTLFQLLMIANFYFAQNGHKRRICQPSTILPSSYHFKHASQTVLGVVFFCPKYLRTIFIFNFSFPSERIWNHWRRSCSFFRVNSCRIDDSSRSWWDIFGADLVLVLVYKVELWNRSLNQIRFFPILSNFLSYLIRFFPIFRLFPAFRLTNFTALVQSHCNEVAKFWLNELRWECFTVYHLKASI